MEKSKESKAKSRRPAGRAGPAAADRTTKAVTRAKPVRTSTRTWNKPAAALAPTQTQIAERAYFLSIERQGPADPYNDWLRAERELRGRFKEASPGG